MTVLSRIFMVIAIVGALGCLFIGITIIKPAKEKLEADLQQEKATVAKLNTDLDSEKKLKETALADLKNTKQKLSDTEDTLKKAQTDLAEREAKIKEVESSLEQATSELEKKKSEIAGILAALPEGLTVDQVGPKIKELQDNLATLDQEKKVLGEQLAKLATEKKRLDSYIADMRDRKMPQGLTGNILAVNRDWNFVVIDIGMNQGVVEKVPMIVHRDGVLIGKVMINSVEPNIAIGDLIPEWKKGEIQEGDLVSF